jgi:multicomponent Na+:H+ antiporter subunit F
VSAWWLASAAFLLATIPCLCVSMRGSPLVRLVGLEALAMDLTLLFITLAQAMSRPAFFDLALTLALLSFGGGLVFARFLERWL